MRKVSRLHLYLPNLSVIEGYFQLSVCKNSNLFLSRKSEKRVITAIDPIIQKLTDRNQIKKCEGMYKSCFGILKSTAEADLQ